MKLAILLIVAHVWQATSVLAQGFLSSCREVRLRVEWRHGKPFVMLDAICEWGFQEYDATLPLNLCLANSDSHLIWYRRLVSSPRQISRTS